MSSYLLQADTPLSRRRILRCWACAVSAALISLSAGAQSPVLPPIHPLGPITAHAAPPLRSVYGLHELGDGNVVVNDPNGHRVVLLDSHLQLLRVILDTTSTAPRQYPRQFGVVFGYGRAYNPLGDSTLFVDPSALAILVIDPTGRVARVVSLPTPAVAPLIHEDVGVGNGGYVYDEITPRVPPPADSLAPPPPPPESALVVRANLWRREADTVARVGLPKAYADVDSVGDDGVRMKIPTTVPITVADGWALTSNGTLAVVRARDFHVDWILPDGAHEASPPLPHEWVRLTSEAKAAILDSTRRWNADHPGSQFYVRNGVTVRRTIVARVPDIDSLPEYKSAFVSVHADADGNLWLQEPSQDFGAGGRVYDLVNAAGKLFDRVRVPGGARIEGFGHESIYLSSSTGTTTDLVRATIR